MRPSEPESSPDPEVEPRAGSPDAFGENLRLNYWRINLVLVSTLLVVWAAVSFGAGLVFAPWLNQFTLPGTAFPLGFWFAQQGAIYVFVLLIFVYVIAMALLERRAGLHGPGDAK